MSGYDGSVLIPDGQLSESSVATLFQKLADEMYTCFKGVLKCGNLESRIVLSPSPLVKILIINIHADNFLRHTAIHAYNYIEQN